jgi:beta-glucosidase
MSILEGSVVSTSFPQNFVWGAGTSAYQIEGGAFDDGKGLSVWDVFAHKQDAIWQGQTGDVACDHYHRYAEDVRLMAEIGLGAYRFSLSWARILPEGTGQVNAAGLDFYDRLVDALLEKNVTPYVTLYHWCLPFALHQCGGWLNPDSTNWFAEYADVVVRRLGDRVAHWLTLNEPAAVIAAGYFWGVHAPGLRLSRRECLLAALHTVVAHGKAVQAIRAASPQPCKISLALDGGFAMPTSDSAEDIALAKRITFGIVEPDVQSTALWFDPIYRGTYPEDAYKVFGADVPNITPEMLATAHQPLDFFGVNIYWNKQYRLDREGKPRVQFPPMGHPYSGGWYVVPEALYWGPRLYWEEFGLPVVITENGWHNPDWVALDGQVHDPQRIDFMTRYLRCIKKAMDEGIRVDGYFYWSLLDNFEWHLGTQIRFGLIHVDYTTLKRTLKDSARWYGDVIRSNGAAIS